MFRVPRGKSSSTVDDIHDLGFPSRTVKVYSMFSTHKVMGLSLHAFWQNELIFRRNFGYSRFDTARTTEGGAQPPGFTAEKRKKDNYITKHKVKT